MDADARKGGWDAQGLWDAAANRSLGECTRLLAAGVPVDSVGRMFAETALTAAARSGFADVAQLLLDYGASIDKPDTDGYTPLSWGAVNGRLAVVRLLLDYGAKVGTTNANGGCTPLLYAAREGHVVVVALLLENGASANFSSVLGQTALLHAAQCGRLDCVRTLLAATLPSGVALEMRRHFA